MENERILAIYIINYFSYLNVLLSWLYYWDVYSLILCLKKKKDNVQCLVIYRNEIKHHSTQICNLVTWDQWTMSRLQLAPCVWILGDVIYSH